MGSAGWGGGMGEPYRTGWGGAGVRRGWTLGECGRWGLGLEVGLLGPTARAEVRVGALKSQRWARGVVAGQGHLDTCNCAGVLRLLFRTHRVAVWLQNGCSVRGGRLPSRRARWRRASCRAAPGVQGARSCGAAGATRALRSGLPRGPPPAAPFEGQHSANGSPNPLAPLTPIPTLALALDLNPCLHLQQP